MTLQLKMSKEIYLLQRLTTFWLKGKHTSHRHQSISTYPTPVFLAMSFPARFWFPEWRWRQWFSRRRSSTLGHLNGSERIFYDWDFSCSWTTCRTCEIRCCCTTYSTCWRSYNFHWEVLFSCEYGCWGHKFQRWKATSPCEHTHSHTHSSASPARTYETKRFASWTHTISDINSIRHRL